MTAEGNNKMFQSYSDYIMETDDLYSQNSVSDIIAAHLKMLFLSFEKYYQLVHVICDLVLYCAARHAEERLTKYCTVIGVVGRVRN